MASCYFNDFLLYDCLCGHSVSAVLGSLLYCDPCLKALLFLFLECSPLTYMYGINPFRRCKCHLLRELFPVQATWNCIPAFTIAFFYFISPLLSHFIYSHHLWSVFFQYKLHKCREFYLFSLWLLFSYAQ